MWNTERTLYVYGICVMRTLESFHMILKFVSFVKCVKLNLNFFSVVWDFYLCSSTMTLLGSWILGNWRMEQVHFHWCIHVSCKYYFIFKARKHRSLDDFRFFNRKSSSFQFNLFILFCQKWNNIIMHSC